MVVNVKTLVQLLGNFCSFESVQQVSAVITTKTWKEKLPRSPRRHDVQILQKIGFLETNADAFHGNTELHLLLIQTTTKLILQEVSCGWVQYRAENF